jgi:hypothetical protein
VVEYCFIIGAILLAVLASDFIPKMRDAFKTYFDYAADTIVKGEDPKDLPANNPEAPNLGG